MPPIYKPGGYWTCFKLSQADKDLIQHLKKIENLKNRQLAVDKLIPIVNGLDQVSLASGPRSLRVWISDTLNETLDAQASRTGLTRQQIFILAAREYKRRTPTIAPYPTGHPPKKTITLRDTTKTAEEWAKACGVSVACIHARLASPNWTKEQALTLGRYRRKPPQ